MTISTYAELKSAVSDWSNNTTVAAVAGDLVTLAESAINRRLRTRWQETTLAATAPDADCLIAVPSGLLAVKVLWLDGDPQWRIEQRTLDFVMSSQAGGNLPRYFAWNDGSFVFDGAGGDVTGVYWTKVPALSDAATTNWLLSAYPDLYLWACLEQAALYVRDVEGAGVIAGRWQGIADEINSASAAAQVSGGKLVARAA